MFAQLHHFNSAQALIEHLLETVHKVHRVHIQVFWYEKMFNILGHISGKVDEFKKASENARKPLGQQYITIEFNGRSYEIECVAYSIDGRSTDFVTFTFKYDEEFVRTIFEYMIFLNTDGIILQANISFI